MCGAVEGMASMYSTGTMPTHGSEGCRGTGRASVGTSGGFGFGGVCGGGGGGLCGGSVANIYDVIRFSLVITLTTLPEMLSDAVASLTLAQWRFNVLQTQNLSNIWRKNAWNTLMAAWIALGCWSFRI